MFLPVPQQGEDHTPHAFHGEFPDPTASLCKQRNGHKRATSCLTSLHCSACARLPQCQHPTLAFLSHNRACAWETEAAVERAKCRFELDLVHPWRGPGGQGEVQNPAGCSPIPLEVLRIPGLKIETR